MIVSVICPSLRLQLKTTKNRTRLYEHCAATCILRHSKRGNWKKRTAHPTILAASCNMRSFETIDPGILWFLAARTCRHRVLASYFNYPDVFYNGPQHGYDCDWCGIMKRKLDPSNTFTAGIPLSLSHLAPKPSIAKASAVRRSTRKLSASDVETLKPTSREKVVEWRANVHKRLNLGVAVPVTIVLANDVIEKVIGDINHICEIADLREKLQPRTGKVRCCLRSSLL